MNNAVKVVGTAATHQLDDLKVGSQMQKPVASACILCYCWQILQGSMSMRLCVPNALGGLGV